MRAALLIRCSTDRQDYERQITDLKRKAIEFGLVVSDDIIFGEHITGRDDATKSTRRSVDNLFKAIEEKKLDCVLISEVSRLSRDPTSGAWWIRQLNNKGIPAYFRDMNKWTIDIKTGEVVKGVEEEILHNLEGAKHYLESLKTQTASGRRRKLQDNQMTQTLAFGYRKKGGKNKYERNTVIPDEEAAPIIKFIYEAYLKEGATLKTTALAATGKYKKTFTVSRIYQILSYKGYHLGYAVVCTTDPDTKKQEIFQVKIGKIIDKELYDAAMKKLKTNRTSSKTRNNAQIEHLLSKLIKCPFCGHSFTPKIRSDKRPTYLWKCMSRINNATSSCPSTINLNDDKVNELIWQLIKKECIVPNNLTAEERERRIEEQLAFIEEMNNEIINLLSIKEANEKKTERAYNAYISAPDNVADLALRMYQKTIAELKEEEERANKRISELKEKMNYCEIKINRYKETDFAKDFFEEVDKEYAKKRGVFKEHIKAIYPYKLAYRKVVLEVQTIDNIFYIIFDSNQRTKQIATYVSYDFAVWQRGENRFLSMHEEGDYFVVPNPSLFMDSYEMDLSLSIEKMEQVCKDNGWIIDYSNYNNNIYKNGTFRSNIEKYNQSRKEAKK